MSVATGAENVISKAVGPKPGTSSRASCAAAAGRPYEYYDLGHGYCTHSFFERYPHRMACARSVFCLPKGSTEAQLVEAKANLQAMLVCIPLTDDERAAVEDGHEAVDRLLVRLVDVATSSGATPRLLFGSPTEKDDGPPIAVRCR